MSSGMWHREYLKGWMLSQRWGWEITWCSLVRVAFGNAFWREPSVTRPLHSFGDALGMIQNGDRISVNRSGISGIQHFGELRCESIVDTDEYILDKYSLLPCPLSVPISSQS